MSDPSLLSTPQNPSPFPFPSHLFVFDFDHTLVDFNSDLIVFDCLQPSLRTYISHQCAKKLPWNTIMNAALAILARDHHVTREDLVRVLNCPQARLTRGAVRLLQCLEKTKAQTAIHKEAIDTTTNSKIQVWILSDSNTFYIEEILQASGVKHCVDRIVTNQARFHQDGRLEILPYQDPNVSHQCTFKCPENLCKGKVLREYLQSLDHIPIIYYFGDGENDVCPSYQIPDSGSIFIRKGYAMEKTLIKNAKLNMSPRAFQTTWVDDDDMLLQAKDRMATDTP